MMHKPTATTEEAMGKMSMYQTEEVYFWKSDPGWFVAPVEPTWGGRDIIGPFGIALKQESITVHWRY
jgi:hypothetical protein